MTQWLLQTITHLVVIASVTMERLMHKTNLPNSRCRIQPEIGQFSQWAQQPSCCFNIRWRWLLLTASDNWCSLLGHDRGIWHCFSHRFAGQPDTELSEHVGFLGFASKIIIVWWTQWRSYLTMGLTALPLSIPPFTFPYLGSKRKETQWTHLSSSTNAKMMQASMDSSGHWRI